MAQSQPTKKKKAGIERHYIACAKQHCNAKTILKVDIKNFLITYIEILFIPYFSVFLNLKAKFLTI
jgi:RNA-directed DNA polymerase